MVKSIYNKGYFTGKSYEQYGDFPAHEGRVDKIISIANPTSVLDVGCAYGFIVKRLLDKGVYAVGMDVSAWCQRKAKEIIPHNFVRHDLRKPLPFRDKVFDLLYCEGVLEHIEEELIDGVMAEFERVSRKRILQISLAEHSGALGEVGHITVKDHAWWFQKMPFNTYMALGATGSEENIGWLYKG